MSLLPHATLQVNPSQTANAVVGYMSDANVVYASLPYSWLADMHARQTSCMPICKVKTHDNRKSYTTPPTGITRTETESPIEFNQLVGLLRPEGCSCQLLLPAKGLQRPALSTQSLASATICSSS